MDHDAHHYSRRLKTQLRLIKSDPAISKENVRLICKFNDYSFSMGISLGRVVRYLFDLRVLAKYLAKDFEKAGRPDIERLVGKLERSKYSKSTIRDLKLTLRKFYKWLRNTDEFPEEVKWYKTHVKYNAITNPEDILTEEEIKKMIKCCLTPRDRAFVSLLYESGCRIGELLLLKLNQVKFDKHGAQVLVNGKTGFRRVRVISCAPYLTEWLNKHPLNDNESSFLWIRRDLKRIEYGSLKSMLERVAERAGVKKRVNPHNFRHSRATHLANFLTEAQMKEYFGWVQASKMASIYVHLSGRDVDNAILKVYGMETDEKKEESKLKPINCQRCGESNQATNKYCSMCGFPLDEKTRTEVIQKTIERKDADDIMDRLLEDQEFREVFLKKVEMLKNQ
jgi:integrase/recombinase XerD